MDADERLTALKKAYADIILNTAKEAAARIMVSESKAVRFQHELGVAKDEALQMLLRLKQMMDFKVHEADMTSLNQKKKIEELEAQLQEAEDIVRDLRDELREVQAELESVVTNNKLRNSSECDTTFQEEAASEENRINTSQLLTASDLENSILNQRSEDHKCFNTNDAHIGIPYDLPSIIMRSKEPELYRNGCTQRIRAFEKNLLDEGLSLSEQIDDVKNGKSVRKDEGEEGIHETPVLEAENTCTRENKVLHVIKSFRKKRKRAVRYKKNTTPLRRYISDQIVRRVQESDLSGLQSNPNSIDAIADESPSQTSPRLSFDTAETGEQLRCLEVTESEPEFAKVGSVEDIITEDNDKPLLDKMVLKREEIGYVESCGVQDCRIDDEKVEVPLQNPESKPSDTTNEISSQPPNDRIIKYTFQRKRKRELSSNSDSNVNASLENSTLTRDTEEIQNGSLGPQKSSSIPESSRDSRRLAQVARQLISLSEKKWWQ